MVLWETRFISSSTVAKRIGGRVCAREGGRGNKDRDNLYTEEKKKESEKGVGGGRRRKEEVVIERREEENTV